MGEPTQSCVSPAYLSREELQLGGTGKTELGRELAEARELVLFGCDKVAYLLIIGAPTRFAKLLYRHAYTGKIDLVGDAGFEPATPAV